MLQVFCARENARAADFRHEIVLKRPAPNATSAHNPDEDDGGKVLACLEGNGEKLGFFLENGVY